MQSLLSRLKNLHDKNSEANERDQSKQDDGGTGKKILLNNFIKNGDSNDSNETAPQQNGLNQNGEIITEPNSARTDDGLIIDVVMASNRTRLRSQNSASSPRPLTKNFRTRGSKLSLNSVSISEKEDFDTSGIDSDDELGSSNRPPVMSPTQAWAAFENSVRTIDNSSPDVFIKKPKPNFVSSGTFQKVMMDMYGNTEYGNTKGYTLLKQKLSGMARATNIASRMLSKAVAQGQEDRENAEIINDDDVCDINEDIPSEEDDIDGPDKVAKVFARRGWKMLKRDVNEKNMETKTQSKKLNWAMLQHTVKQMSNVERTRQDLYERYGVVPSVQEDGSMKCENKMLSARARAQLQGRTSGDGDNHRRPNSYQPPPTHLRSHSSSSGYYMKERNSAKLPNIGKSKQRPVTALR